MLTLNSVMNGLSPAGGRPGEESSPRCKFWNINFIPNSRTMSANGRFKKSKTISQSRHGRRRGSVLFSLDVWQVSGCNENVRAKRTILRKCFRVHVLLLGKWHQWQWGEFSMEQFIGEKYKPNFPFQPSLTTFPPLFKSCTAPGNCPAMQFCVLICMFTILCEALPILSAFMDGKKKQNNNFTAQMYVSLWCSGP